jgi:putative FmdB family regulatory protein
MPVYTFRCLGCGQTIDTTRTIEAVAHLEITCDRCGGEMKRIFSAPSVRFKGPGFYSTDNRKAK